MWSVPGNGAKKLKGRAQPRNKRRKTTVVVTEKLGEQLG